MFCEWIARLEVFTSRIYESDSTFSRVSKPLSFSWSYSKTQPLSSLTSEGEPTGPRRRLVDLKNLKRSVKGLFTRSMKYLNQIT